MDGEQVGQKLTWRTPLLRARVLVLTLLIAFLCYGFFTWILWPVKVAGQSMMPNYLDGSRHFINKLAYFSSEPQRGDVVGLRALNGDVYMKRIVGLPGERVAFRGGRILINGRRLKENYVQSMIPPEFGENSMRLGASEYFVIGDNRATSVFGSINREQIIGKVIY